METPGHDVDPKLLANLRSRKAEVREAAERQLAAKGPEAVNALLAMFEKEAVTRAKRRKIGFGIVAAYGVLFIVILVLDHGNNIGSLGGMTGAIIALFAATQVQKDAARALARYDDKRGVGRLVEALEYQDKHVQTEVEAALIRLLPTLNATDHTLLTLDQRRVLYKAIVKRKKAPLALAVLDAYEQVGDTDSLEVVERMAAGHARGVDAEVEKRAAEVLPAMRVRAEAVRAAQTLLRPAEMGDSGMLLRPVETGPASPVETLVRPVVDADSVAEAASVATNTAQVRLGSSGP